MRRAARFGIVVLAVLLAGACSDTKRPASAPASFDPFGSAASSDRPSPQVVAPSAVAVGTCFDADGYQPGTPIPAAGVRVTDCNAPHQHEVYAIVLDPDPAGAPYPGDGAMRSFGDDKCLAAFKDALGIEYQTSALDFATITPDRAAWAAGERTIVCAVHDADFAPLTVPLVTTSTASSGGSAALESG